MLVRSNLLVDGIFLGGLTVIDLAVFVERFSSNQFSLPLPERTCPELLILDWPAPL